VHRLCKGPSDTALLQIIPKTGIRKIREMKLYVGNLSFNTSNQDLVELFKEAGPVTSANVIEDRETGRSRGFGFVEMENDADGQNAIEQFNGRDVDGRSLKVNEAKPQGDGGGRGGFRGGNRGGGGGGGGRGGNYGGRSW
jgi:cold-inducible RNA-binding protein